MTHRPSEGFTLIEVMVSLMILGVSLFSLWGFHWTSQRINMKNSRETTALFLAEDKLEDFRAEPDTALAAGTTTESLPFGNVTFVRTSTVTQEYPSNIEIKVEWQEKGAAQGSVVLRTFIVLPSDLAGEGA
jgi:prepilin-type N-terminal cleavage/methylation domain-containing protein